MSGNRGEEEKRSQLIKKKFLSTDLNEDSNTDEEQAKIGFLLKIWYSIRGYALDDVDRLYKAGVNHAEARANKPMFENKKLDAEATEKYMQAELKRQEIVKKKIENQRELVELEKEKLELESKELENFEREIKAFERLKRAINTIKAKNGEVLFSSKQIQKMLSNINEEISSEIEESNE